MMHWISILTGICLIVSLLYGLLLILQWMNWHRIPDFMGSKKSTETRLSVIIAMRNEEYSISACLESLKLQDYKKEFMEVIVIDDHSTDHSVRVVNNFINSNKMQLNIRLIELKDTVVRSSYKKHAISEGIKQATGELIITTDADCFAGPQWLSTIVQYYEIHRPVMMMCPVSFKKQGSFFEHMQALEFAGLIGMSAATNRMGFPLMCNGANLAYTKKAFEEIHGFGDTPAIASGDDTFLLFKMKDRFPDGIHFIKNMKANVVTRAQESIPDFFRQRKRWASKTTQYNKSYVTATGFLIYLFNFFIVLSLLMGIGFPEFILVFMGMITIKLIAEFLFMFPVCKFFNRQELLWIFLPVSVMFVPYILAVGLVAPFGGYVWKGRSVK